MTGKNIAIILARGGSKSIPKKNIIDFCGKPLIAWSIKQARSSKLIDQVWVSSDDNSILSISTKYGAKTIVRPKKLATSKSSSVSGWLHAINEIEKNNTEISAVVGLQATSPVRESKDLDSALRKFSDGKYDSIFSASDIGDFFIWRKSKNGFSSINYDYKNRPRRQDFEEQYVENGSFYIFKPQILRKYKNQIGGKIGISLMEFWKSFEIDDFADLEFCKIIMTHYLVEDKNA